MNEPEALLVLSLYVISYMFLSSEGVYPDLPNAQTRRHVTHTGAYS